MSKLIRLDAEMVRRGLARSRGQAAELIAAGRVRVDGGAATKPATQISTAQAVELAGQEPVDDYVSRGAHKLLGALQALGAGAPTIAGRICLDAGASTGGFTDVLLREGAQCVIGVDVGYGQLAWKLRTDPRVITIERTNVRFLTADQLPMRPQVVVADLSFISLTQVLAALADVCAAPADLLVMVKPQFEVGRESLPHGGVVREARQRADAVAKVASCGIDLGMEVAGVVASPLPGPKGNVEFFIHFRKGYNTGGLTGEALQAAIDQAVRDNA